MEPLTGFGSVALKVVIGKVCDEASSRIVEETIRRILQRRAEVSRDIALQEIAAGRGDISLSAPATDEMIAILWRYLRAAQEGAAHLNLRLMASIFAGRDGAPPLYASDFLRWADLIASVSQEEIRLLAVLHRECQAHGSHHADAITRKALIPAVLADEDEYELTAYALVRTGLVRPISEDWITGKEGFGGAFVTTRRMTELARLADLDGVIDRAEHHHASP